VTLKTKDQNQLLKISRHWEKYFLIEYNSNSSYILIFIILRH